MHDLDRTLRNLEPEDGFSTGELDPEIFGSPEPRGELYETPSQQHTAAGSCSCGCHGRRAASGRWVRRGRAIVLIGA